MESMDLKSRGGSNLGDGFARPGNAGQLFYQVWPWFTRSGGETCGCQHFQHREEPFGLDTPKAYPKVASLNLRAAGETPLARHRQW